MNGSIAPVFYKRSNSMAVPLVLAVAVQALGGSAHGGFVSAAVSGGLPSGFTNQDQEFSDTGVSPVVVTMGQTQPGKDWNWQATATAGYGRLGTSAEASGNNMFGSAGQTARADTTASFADRWIFMDQPLDSSGQFRLSVHFDGTAIQTAGTNGFVQSYAALVVNLVARDKNGSSVGSEVIISSGNIAGSVNTTYVSSPVLFFYGRPIDVNASVGATVRVSPFTQGKAFSGAGKALFGNTASFMKVEVLDANGDWTTKFSLDTAAAARYPFEPDGTVFVPAPTTLTMVLTGLGTLLFSVRVRRASRTRLALAR